MSDRGGGLTRDVILRISAQNLSTADFRTATNAVNELTAAVDKQVQAAAKGTVKEAELTAALSKLNDVSKNLQGFSKIIENLKGLDVQIAAQVQKLAEAKKAWEDQQATIAAADNVTQRMTTRLAGLERAHKAAETALQGQIARQQAYRNTLEQNGLDVQNLANAERQLLTVAEQAGIVVNKLTQARDNYAKILRQTKEAEQAAAAAAKAAAEAEAARVAEIRKAIAAIEARKQAEQAARLADVGAGTKQITDRAETERRIQREITEGAAKAATEQRAIRMAAVQAEVEANAKRREDANKTERAIAADRARAAAEVAEGARRGTPASAERMAEIRRNIEESSRLRQIEIRSEIEDERRRGIGVLGRMREDMAARRALRRQESEEQLAERRRTGGGQTSQPGFLGLRSYELTNLGYQATDVFQGAISGVGFGTIAAQQGPQIFQLFGLAALKWSPIIVAGFAAVTVAIGAFERMLREAAANREFGGLLAANAQSVNYNKEQLVDLGKAAHDMGMSWKDGIDAIKTAMSGNIAQDRIKSLLQAAQDVEDVYGTKAPEAMKQFVAGLSGSADELIKLGNEYRLFTPLEQEHIRRQVAAGNVEDARRFTIERLTQSMRERAKVATSDWTVETRKLSAAWDDFLVSIGKTQAFKDAYDWLVKIIGETAKLARQLDDITQNKPGARQGLWEYIVSNLIGERSLLKQATGIGMPTPASPTGAIPATEPVYLADTKLANPRNIKFDNEAMTALARVIAQASKELPEGYTVVPTSGERPGARVKGTGELSEHHYARAIDIKIVDPTGKDVPGSMSVATELYLKLDKAVEAQARRMLGNTPLAIGSTFDDAGHYSIAGPEAVANERKRGAGRGPTTSASAADASRSAPVSTGPTPDQADAGREALKQEKERYAIAHAISVEDEKQKEFARIEREVRQSNKDPVSAAGEIRIKQREVELKLQEEQQARQRKLEQEDIDRAKYLTEIRAAGEKAVAEARARGIEGYRELQRIEDDAKTREANRLNRIDQEKDRYQGIVTAIDNVKRSLDGAYGPDVQARIDAVRLKYKDLGEQIRRALRENVLTDKAPLEAELRRLPALQEREEFVARGKAYEDQAKAALAARNDLIQSYNKLYDVGAITLEEKNKGIEESYKRITPALTEATDSLEKWNQEARERGDVPAIQIDRTTAAIKEFRAETLYLSPFWKGLKSTIEDSFGSNLTEAFNTVSEAIGKAIAKTGEWKDVMVSLKTAAGSFFAGILKDIANYIIKYEALRLLQSAGMSLPGLGLGGVTTAATTAGGAAASSGGFFSFLSGAGGSIPAVLHGGGVVGITQAPRRPAQASWFERAPRYHTGAVVGLAANEQSAILQRGEEVLTRDSPRNVMNLRGGAAPDINIRNVLVADPELVPSHMGSLKGERVIMNVLTKNAATVRQLVR